MLQMLFGLLWCCALTAARSLCDYKRSVAAIVLKSGYAGVMNGMKNCSKMSKRTHSSAPAPPNRAQRRNIFLLY